MEQNHVSFCLTGNLARSFFNQLSSGSGFFVIKKKTNVE